MENQELTYGQKAVGLTFNPSGDDKVNRIKELYAEIIDICYDSTLNHEGNPMNGEKIRLFKVAITEAQTGSMWAVKAITWKE